jgi:hypothetical protein
MPAAAPGHRPADLLASAAEARIRALTGRDSVGPACMTTEEITAMASAITDIVAVLHAADPADKPELYAQLGLRLTY